MLENITNLINKTLDLLGGGVSNILMTLAFLAFVWSVINFIWTRRKGDANGLQQATQMLWWSIIGLTAMVTVWGIVNFLATNILGNDANKTNINRPQTKFGGTSSGSSGSSQTSGSAGGSSNRADTSLQEANPNKNSANSQSYSTNPSDYTDSSCKNGGTFDSFGSACSSNK